MKMKHFIYLLIAVLLPAAFLPSCDEWTEPENVGIDYRYAWEQHPELWERYAAAVRAYKESEHHLVYAEFCNAPAVEKDESAYLRCLPDSLDLVSLANAARLSAADLEDLEVLHRLGTKVLYHLDLAALTAAEAEPLVAAACESVEEHGLDGFSLRLPTDLPPETSALLERLDLEGRLLVFEGSPARLAGKDRDRVDLFVLDTRRFDYLFDTRLDLLAALESGIDSRKLLLSAEADGRMKDDRLKETGELEALSAAVTAWGPLGGIALYRIAADYHHNDEIYSHIERVIAELNPSR